MDNSRQEYSALLSLLDPNQAVNVLNDRVELISQTNNDIANWLLEKRKVEELYAQGLRRLARRPQRDGGASLGIFQLPWQRIIESTESLAQSHESLAQKIEVDAETPLRQFATKSRELQGISTTQGNLSSIAKEYGHAQKKVDKLKDKSGRFSSSRTANASSTTEDANQQWESQAPYIFEQLQALDESRVNHLRDVLTQFQTHEVDSIEQNRKPAELCLNALLNIETAEEIKTFVARISTEPRQAPTSRRRSSASSNIRRLSSAGGGPVPPMPPPPRLTNDRARPTVSFPNETVQPAAVIEPKETPKRQGFKSRLGTVIGRRKHTTPPPVPSIEKAKKEKNRSSLMPFRRADSSRSQQANENISNSGRDLSTAISNDERQPRESPMRRFQPDQSLPVSIHASSQQNPSLNSGVVNGTTNHVTVTRSNIAHDQNPASNNLPVLSEQPPHDLNISPPNPVQHMDVISRAEQEAAATNAENEEAFRRLKIRDQPIQEDEREAQQAISKMTNQLRMQAQSSGINRVGGSMRGRRDVRNTIFVPSPEPPFADTESVVSEPALHASPGTGVSGSAASGVTAASHVDNMTTSSPMKAPAAIAEEGTMSDTTSVHSAQSLGPLIHHPEMHEPGLNSSIVETVSTWFSDSSVSKSFVIGEVALAYNPTQANAETEMIMLENFQALEKIAPNPSFVSAISSDKGKEMAVSEEGAGRYIVALPPIKRSTPIVAFKYRLHLDATNLSLYSPVLLTPAWQIQDGQASVILMYTLNPAFVMSTTPPPAATTPMTLKNVVVCITLDPSSEAGKATSAMMAPQNGAVFKRKQGMVVWRFPELVVSTEKQKLLARFVTAGAKARPGQVEARWELADMTGSRLGVSVMGGGGKTKEATDPFADGGTALPSPGRGWGEIHTARRLISGRYIAT